MARYLVQGTYTAEGAKGVLAKGGSARQSAVEEMLKGLGGSVESFYFAFGDTDFYVVAELPDAVSAAAVGLTVSAAGGVRANTTVLLTPEEVDKAVAKKIGYRPPGA